MDAEDKYTSENVRGKFSFKGLKATKDDETFVVTENESKHLCALLFQPNNLNWDLSVDKDSLPVRPTDKTLSKYIQTVDRQCLAGKHVGRLQATFTGVSTEPGTDQGLVPSSRGHCTARYHAAVPPTWKTIRKLLLLKL